MPDDVTEDAALAGEVVSDAFDGPGDWLPPADAARRIGVSERTLWRRVNAGQFLRRVASGKALILVPLAGSVPNATELAVPAAPDTLTVAVIEELKRQHDESAARLTRQADEIRALAERAGRAEAEAALLRADLERERRRSPWKPWTW